ncbi:MAG: S8 family serine peptidase [Actinomycetota bacterium]
MLTAAARQKAGRCLLAVAAVTGSAVAATARPAPAQADSVRSAEQWVLDAVDAPAAWPQTQGHGVTVAVIDSGVKPTVDDLTGSVTSGPDLSGVSTPQSDANWGMHGTWMASLIAGHGHGTDEGITGVAPQARVLSIRVLPDKKDPAYRQYQHESSRKGQHALARAITYAVTHQASVISMSLGYGAASRVVRAALQDATRHNVVVVASSGNSGRTATSHGRSHAPYSFPADYPGVLGVAAVDQAGKSAAFSSDNLSVQVAAPGVRVPAQGSDGQYWLVSGTSPACALTAGVAALIKSVYPSLPPALVIRAITASTQHHPPGGYDDRVGFGTVDAVAALTAAKQLMSYRASGHGYQPQSHFGGGPKAIPPSPIAPRGPGSLVGFGLLALACLLVTIAAASRLRRSRRRWPALAGAVAPSGPPGAWQSAQEPPGSRATPQFTASPPATTRPQAPPDPPGPPQVWQDPAPQPFTWPDPGSTAAGTSAAGTTAAGTSAAGTTGGDTTGGDTTGGDTTGGDTTVGTRRVQARRVQARRRQVRRPTMAGRTRAGRARNRRTMTGRIRAGCRPGPVRGTPSRAGQQIHPARAPASGMRPAATGRPAGLLAAGPLPGTTPRGRTRSAARRPSSDRAMTSRPPAGRRRGAGPARSSPAPGSPAPGSPAPGSPAPGGPTPGGPDEFSSRVLEVTDKIPPGYVMSYGDIAEYLGDGGPRQVGRVMALWGGGVTWWRVVHSDGSLLSGHEQEALRNYRAEGTPLRPPGSSGLPRIDMRRARWDGMT